MENLTNEQKAIAQITHAIDTLHSVRGNIRCGANVQAIRGIVIVETTLEEAAKLIPEGPIEDTPRYPGAMSD